MYVAGLATVGIISLVPALLHLKKGTTQHRLKLDGAHSTPNLVVSWQALYALPLLKLQQQLHLQPWQPVHHL